MLSVKLFRVCTATDPQSLSAPSAAPWQCSASQWPPRPDTKKTLKNEKWWKAASKNWRCNDVKELTATWLIFTRGSRALWRRIVTRPQPGKGLLHVHKDTNEGFPYFSIFLEKKQWLCHLFLKTNDFVTFSWPLPSGRRTEQSSLTNPPIHPTRRPHLELEKIFIMNTDHSPSMS